MVRGVAAGIYRRGEVEVAIVAPLLRKPKQVCMLILMVDLFAGIQNKLLQHGPEKDLQAFAIQAEGGLHNILLGFGIKTDPENTSSDCLTLSDEVRPITLNLPGIGMHQCV